MNILVIHNDNLPDISVKDENIRIKELKLEPPVIDFDNYDEFVSDVLGAEFKQNKNNYDLIVLPYSLSSKNYMEFSGITVALHIRLTKDWNHTKKPILFVGPDKPEEVMKFSPLGDFLNTSYVFKTPKKGESDFLRMFEYIRDDISSEMSDSQYEQFINRIHIEAPANYGRHALANEWSMMRWTQRYKNLEGKFVSGVQSLLFLKYLLVKNQIIEKIKNKDKSQAIIANIKDLIHSPVGLHKCPKIMFIDDEYKKGWGSIFSQIFKDSGVDENNFLIFKDFVKGEAKGILINKINAFIDNNDADLFIVDLRLHDADFNCTYDEISGHEIIKHLANGQHKGKQIIIFTASEKANNLKLIVENNPNITDYVIKDSPDKKVKKTSSNSFDSFSQAVQKAFKRIYIRQYLTQLIAIFGSYEGIPFKLRNFIDLLILDKSENKNNVVGSMLIILNAYLEDYITSQRGFCIDGNQKLIYKNWRGRDCEISFPHDFMYFSKDKRSVQFLDSQPYAKNGEMTFADNSQAYTKIIRALRNYYDFDLETLNLVCNLKQERNIEAHQENNSDINFEDIKKLFEVILKILELDKNKS